MLRLRWALSYRNLGFPTLGILIYTGRARVGVGRLPSRLTVGGASRESYQERLGDPVATPPGYSLLEPVAWIEQALPRYEGGGLPIDLYRRGATGEDSNSRPFPYRGTALVQLSYGDLSSDAIFRSVMRLTKRPLPRLRLRNNGVSEW